MKKHLYFLYIGLMLPLVLACEKQNIEPTGEFTDIISDTLEARTASCVSYSYLIKSWEGALETTHLGNAQGELILVGFTENLSISDRYQILSRYPRFNALGGEIIIDSGPVTVVSLKKGSTCQNAESMIKDLALHEQVVFAYPTFGTPDNWKGLSNEFIVTIQGTASYVKFKKHTETTGTKIVSLLEEFTIGNQKYFIYKLKADKSSAGNVLQICDSFNQQPFILEAVPNFVFKPFEPEPVLTQSATSAAEEIKQKGLSALKNPSR